MGGNYVSPVDQKTSDRPDLIVRVFRLKLKGLLSDLIKRQVFGKPLAHVYTIEFQNRGLPHAHILVILADEDKPRDPSQYDTILSAEIPDRLDNPRLYNIVKRCMIHGSCGLAKRIAPCMRDGNCSKKYPKEFSSIATTVNDGYPIYRRMDNSDGSCSKKYPKEFSSITTTANDGYPIYAAWIIVAP